MSGLWLLLHSVVQGVSLGIGFVLGQQLVQALDRWYNSRRRK